MLLINKESISGVFQVLEVMAITGGTVETLDEIPPHVWKGLPDSLSLGTSAINPSRIGGEISVTVPYFENCKFHKIL